MKKNNITLVFVAIVFSIIVGMIIGKSLLKYKEGEPDVVGSFSMNRDENLTVVANRKNISDKEAFATTVRFSSLFIEKLPKEKQQRIINAVRALVE